MNFSADLDIFFADSDATMQVGAGTPFPIIFNEAGQEVAMFDGSVMSTGPVALVKTAYVTANAIDNGTAVAVTSPQAGLTAAPYTVLTAKPDGLGLSVVTLTKG